MADQYNIQNKVGKGGFRRKPVALMPEDPPTSTALEQSSPFLKQVSPVVVEQDADFPKSWPTRPELVKSSIISIITDIFIDTILLGLSLAFFTFGLVVRHYDQAPVAVHKGTVKTLLEATKYGPSVFPILFACVLGRAAQAILAWRLELGERVGVLDLLASSTSLTSTVTSQFKLRMVSFLGLALILIWSLSPIGGQASFRQLSIGTRIDNEPASFTYMIFNGNMEQYDNTGRITSFGIINNLFATALISPITTKLAPTDTWGNIKIPMIENYESLASPDSEGWFSTNTSINVYSSLVGIPMSSMDKTFINYEMNIETSYFNLNCSTVDETGKSRVTKLPPGNFTGSGAQMWSSDNDTQRHDADVNTLEPRQIGYQSWFPPVVASQCTMATTYVEVKIHCDSPSNCAASKLRRSHQPHLPPAYILIDHDWQGWRQFAVNFITAFPGHDDYATVATSYIVEPDDPLTYVEAFSMPTAPSKPLTTEVFEQRFGQLLNTYWTCLNGMHAVTNGMTPTTAYMQGTNTSAVDYQFFYANSSTTNGTRDATTPVMECNIGWVVALCIASAVMIIASLVHPIIHYFYTRGPDLMLNISSLAMRDNPYIAVPANGTFMAASDRARMLKGFKVRFGDVDETSDVGRLAIGSLEPPGKYSVGTVSDRRLYY
ncbi:hypothetical protein LSUB1_G000132 [Lachnellula subtilissima]|uniref:Uncharacterized protein n=1 Tax=Lachnellula subtilissima TaxID=602034 RepID=A0A8H8S328_9HELO|nr:hypothetical protein LSUB1_G000132 [Lachnellula subtilissima]